MSQTLSSSGELWLDTKKLQYDYEWGQEFRFGRFDGNQWTNGVGGGFSWIAGLPNGHFVGAKGDTGIAKHDSVVGIYDGQQWNDVSLPGQTITAMTVAPDGAIWIATLDKIFRYVSRTWHKITPPWAGREFGSVSSIAIAEDGTAWFGFSFDADGFGRCGIRMDYANEWGVYRYDGKTWTHFTADDGLVDNKICALALDAAGNAWFGSFVKGVSQFDGSHWKTYQIP